MTWICFQLLVIRGKVNEKKYNGKFKFAISAAYI